MSSTQHLRNIRNRSLFLRLTFQTLRYVDITLFTMNYLIIQHAEVVFILNGLANQLSLPKYSPPPPPDIIVCGLRISWRASISRLADQFEVDTPSEVCFQNEEFWKGKEANVMVKAQNFLPFFPQKCKPSACCCSLKWEIAQTGQNLIPSSHNTSCWDLQYIPEDFTLIVSIVHKECIDHQIREPRFTIHWTYRVHGTQLFPS